MFMMLISSCVYTSSPTIDTKTDEKIKLRFISSWGGVDSQSDPLNMIFSEFTKKNIEIEISNQSVYGEDFLPKIKTDFASGNDPDVFGLWPGSDITALVKAGKVADLTDVLENDPTWKYSFKEDSWGYTTYEGKIYGIPFERIFEGLFINKDLFDKYSIKVPRTYEELKIAVKLFRSHNITPIAFNYSSEGTYLYQNILANLGGKYQVENPIGNGNIKECYVTALEYLKDLNDLGAFPQQQDSLETVDIDNKDRDNMFLEKKAAMIVQGSWFVGRIGKNVDTVDIIPFPYIEEGVSQNPSLIYGLGCGTFYISKAAWDDPKKREASLKLLKELTSRKSAELFALKSGMISNLNINVSGLNYNYLTLKGLDLMKKSKELIGPPDSYVDRTAWEEIIVKQIPYVLEDKRDAKNVWNDYLRYIQKKDMNYIKYN